ncbi:MAG TPA: low temperature requirement protein A [Vicinamibacterales bacterium]|nr:low temperature requirement protein A [Vicinamibacterales bacterium]
MSLFANVQPLRLRCGGGAEPGRRATWLELFFDLAFVAAVAQVGTPLGADYSLAGLARYAFLFLLIWWAWNGHTMFATRFDNDDVVQRLLALTQIFVVAVMAVNAKDALDSRSSAGFAAAYAVMRFVLAAQYVRARQVPESRELATIHAAGFGLAAACWLVSALIPAPARFWLWGVALAIDLGTPIVSARHTLRVPPHAEHLPERFGLFTIILLGESLVAIMKGMESQEGWSPAAASSAFLGMAIAFLVWWWYFHGVSGAAERAVRTAAQARRFMVWSFAHLPLYLGIAVAGVGIEHIIRIAPDGHLHGAEIWILCGAAALFMTSLTTIGATAELLQEHPARWRVLAPRYAISLLPLAVAAFGSAWPPALQVAALAAMCFTQLLLAVGSGPGLPEEHRLAPANLET